MSKIKETWGELHISVLPVLGWTAGGKWLTKSPAALASAAIGYITGTHPEDCDCAKCAKNREEKLSKLFAGCTIACPVDDDSMTFHRHVLDPEEVAALINARIRVGMDQYETHEIIREVLESVEHT